MSESKPGENVLVLVKVKAVIETAGKEKGDDPVIRYEVMPTDGSCWIMHIPELDVFDPVTRLSGQDIDRRTAMEMEAKSE